MKRWVPIALILLLGLSTSGPGHLEIPSTPTPLGIEILKGAKAEVTRNPTYRSAYYAGGYPPEDEGVCTDLVWRALLSAGYDLKLAMDRDIAANPGEYPRVERPDPNIDFRRVPNQVAFFRRHALVLTTQVTPGDSETLSQWQPGDIVAWGSPAWHVGIISDRRRPDGVPYVLHNSGRAREQDALLSWPSPIIGHFRLDAPRPDL